MTESTQRKIIPGFVAASAACPNCAQVTCYLGKADESGIMERSLVCGHCGETVRVSVLVRRDFDAKSDAGKVD